MLEDSTTIFVAASGPLVPAGMRRLLAYVVKNRFVDVLVMSGAMLFHDLHETFGRQHFQAHPSMTDAELESAQVDRMCDVLASEEEYREAQEWIGNFVGHLEQARAANQPDQPRPFSTREFMHLLGRELSEIATEDGLLTAAYKSRVPVFCPDIVDSPLAIGMAMTRFEKKNTFYFDLVQDVLDMALIAQRARVSGVINIGGGIPRSFVQQIDTTVDILKTPARGHKYGIQISPDVPHPQGCATPIAGDETIVYGKLARGASLAYVNCDATIALPILITSLSQTAAKYKKGRKRPTFTFAPTFTVEVS